MASRFRSISRPAFNFIKSSINKPTTKPISSSQLPRSFPTFSRAPSEMGCVQSLLPFHSAVSSARLTSCLGTDNSRSLSQDGSKRAAIRDQMSEEPKVQMKTGLVVARLKIAFFKRK